MGGCQAYSIHTNLMSPSDLIHKGRLNAPIVQEMTILMPDNDVITKKPQEVSIIKVCVLCCFVHRSYGRQYNVPLVVHHS
jgi:hypothetical protein